MHSYTVFRSGLVTRLNSISWQPSNNYAYTQPFRKDNTNSITSILSKGPIPLTELSQSLKSLSLLCNMCCFSIYYIFLLSNLNSHFDTKLRLGAADSFENDDFLVVKHSQKMTQFWLKLNSFQFLLNTQVTALLKYQAMCTPSMQHPFFDHDMWSRQTLVSWAIYFLSYT